ncbi:hypothetical protein NBRC116583_27210 [Arenicella sp. 4NH20-0111]|uniref:multiheme c-type cytochrome n=1 Tax=Arenicella sp. 4NH20-0111 TaxID=3127648 RepID=UPI0031072480
MQNSFIQKALMALMVGALSLQLATASDSEQVLPQYDNNKHMGVATCGNAICHGVRNLSEPSNVRQNEYHTWLLNDRHSQSYKTLMNEQSKRIAKNLGLKSAATADICLDCHADNVREEMRGDEFHITDGVGCEACHGGSEKWLATHTLTPYSATRNISDGMYPSAPLANRTELCTSCHVGNSKKLANHNIMGAGHPRLGFELDTFTARQPQHYDVDADYLERKNADTPIRRMLIGAALHARATAQNLTGSLLDHPQGFPEIALFNCHSCHKPLDDQRWQNRPTTAGLKPGSIRLNDGSLILLAAVSGAIDKAFQDKIVRAIKDLHVASRSSIAEVKRAADQVIQLTEQAETKFKRLTISKNSSQLMLIELAKFGVRGEYRDYTAAEQALMAMDAIHYQYPGNLTLESMLNKGFQLTKSDETFEPNDFRTMLSSFLKSE